MKVTALGTLALAALSVSTLFVVAGCDGGSQAPQSIASEERVDQIVEMRKIYDKAGGKWENLTEADRAAYIKMAGDEAQAKTMWTAMSTPMGTAPNTGAAPNIPVGGAQPAPTGG